MKQWNPETKTHYDAEGPETLTRAMEVMYGPLARLCGENDSRGMWDDPLVLAANADLLARALVELSDLALWTSIWQRGFTHTEAAVALGISRQAVAARLKRR